VLTKKGFHRLCSDVNGQIDPLVYIVKTDKLLGNFDSFVYHFICPLSILFLYFFLVCRLYILFFLGDISFLQATV